MKRVLVLYYSQTGQLSNVVKSFTDPLNQSDNVDIVYQNIEPKTPYPFPWGKIEFFDIFPESVYMDGCKLQEFTNIEEEDDFDLIILAYTVWFLSPSLPISGFLNSKYAKLLKNKPVITLITCRNMWIMAQEKVKDKLSSLGAKLIDNVVLIDQGGNVATFITTPRWMWTGKKNSILGLPKAGVSLDEIQRASRFGFAIKDALHLNLEKEGNPLLGGLKAVRVDNKLIGTEKIAHKSFLIWGKFIKKFGNTGDATRIPVLILYFIFLLTLILTVVPINMLIKPIIRKLNPQKLEDERIYLERPSGSGDERLKDFIL